MKITGNPSIGVEYPNEGQLVFGVNVTASADYLPTNGTAPQVGPLLAVESATVR